MASRPEGAQPSSPAPGDGPTSGTRATLALGATGRPCRDQRDQSQPVGYAGPTRHRRASLVAGAGRLPRRARSSEGRTASRGQQKPNLSEPEKAEIAELARLATRNAGGVPLGDPRRVASERFSTLLASAHNRGVTWRELSAASGLTVAGLKARVARHGLGGQVPKYKGVQSRPGPRS